MLDLKLPILVLIALPALLNLWGIRHAFHRAFPTPQERLLWIGVCIFVPLLGGLAYLFFGMRRSRRIGPDGNS